MKNNEKLAFRPSEVNIMLIRQAAEGEFVKANIGSAFQQSLANEEFTLSAGKYYLMVDPIWNVCAEN